MGVEPPHRTRRRTRRPPRARHPDASPATDRPGPGGSRRSGPLRCSDRARSVGPAHRRRNHHHRRGTGSRRDRSPIADQGEEMTNTTAIAETGAQILAAVRTVVVGMDDPLEIALATVLARGHVLFEVVPGLGNTLAARSLAAALGLSSRRLQCTPDMLPGDVPGSYVYAPDSGEFVFRPGP